MDRSQRTSVWKNMWPKKKNGTFRTPYKEKIPDAFRVYCYALVLKKTNTSPVKDAEWFNA